jgi:hypothetical protein
MTREAPEVFRFRRGTKTITVQRYASGMFCMTHHKDDCKCCDEAWRIVQGTELPDRELRGAPKGAIRVGVLASMATAVEVRPFWALLLDRCIVTEADGTPVYAGLLSDMPSDALTVPARVLHVHPDAVASWRETLAWHGGMGGTAAHADAPGDAR